MKKNKVSLCTGTACFVMGGSELLLLEEQLSDSLKTTTDIEGIPCFGLCKNTKHFGAPFVKINDEVIEQATVQKIISRLIALQ
jgi:NADH:ubiquinone oxidoreductase subunit E